MEPGVTLKAVPYYSICCTKKLNLMSVMQSECIHKAIFYLTFICNVLSFRQGLQDRYQVSSISGISFGSFVKAPFEAKKR